MALACWLGHLLSLAELLAAIILLPLRCLLLQLGLGPARQVVFFRCQRTNVLVELLQNLQRGQVLAVEHDILQLGLFCGASGGEWNYNRVICGHICHLLHSSLTLYRRQQLKVYRRRGSVADNVRLHVAIRVGQGHFGEGEEVEEFPGNKKGTEISFLCLLSLQ